MKNKGECPVRKAVKVEATERKHWYRKTLECGHVVVRQYHSKRTHCEECKVRKSDES